MNEELILKILNVPVLVGWLAMMLAPRSRFTRWLVESDVLPLGIGVLYLALVAPHLPGLLREFDTLAHIGAALQRPGCCWRRGSTTWRSTSWWVGWCSRMPSAEASRTCSSCRACC